MTMRDEIINRVRSNQAAGGAATSPAPLRFVAEYAAPADTADIESRIDRVLHLKSRVTRLSEAYGPSVAQPDDALARFVVIETPGAAREQLSPSPFEFGYALADATGAITVEPELGTDFFADDAGTAESVGNFPPGCWVDDSLDPSGAAPLWAVTSIRAVAAWTLEPPANGKKKGEGVSVFQPDTGVTAHAELAGAIDQSQSHDFVDNKPGAVDPMDYAGNPGHGTGTASVVAGRGASHRMSGAAPAARLVPLRAVTAVVVFDHGRVAAAVEHARRNGADVITMSLGGAWSSALRAAIDRAIADGAIVLAAAGNCVGFVVYPARYEEVIAVAGVNSDDAPWRGTCRGYAVDISAPGEFVPRANCAPVNGGGPTDVRGGQGTSFAVALTAGVAALWLAYHGKDAIRAALGPGETVQQKFAALLKATARQPAGWDGGQYGAGVVDAERLLRASLMSVAEQMDSAPVARRSDEFLSVRTLLKETAGKVGESLDAPTAAAPVERRLVAELTHLAMQDSKPAGQAESIDRAIVPSETLSRRRAEFI